jgi:predicted amidophosphoribosyltransferase
MPTEQQYAERTFSGGLGRRAAFGCCADCGVTLQDVTQLVCRKCRRALAEDPAFLEREAGHRNRVSDLFSGVHDASLTFEKVNAIYRRKLNPRGGRKAA